MNKYSNKTFLDKLNRDFALGWSIEEKSKDGKTWYKLNEANKERGLLNIFENERDVYFFLKGVCFLYATKM
jgi:hypothetical protein